MRAPILLCFFLFAFLTKSPGQNCPENITVNSQQDLEDLMLQYPDCAHIPGNVFLKNFSDLSPLSGIITIGGDLKVTSAYSLTHLNGLSSLSSVGNLILMDSEVLTSLSGLESLSKVEGYVNIQLENLESLNGLSGLTEVSGNFTIDNNTMLTNLSGLENLEEVGGDLNIRTNEALTSVEEMSSLQFVGDVLSITDNESIQIISGFGSLHTIEGGLNIVNNDQLFAAYGFDTLTTVGWVRIDNSANGLAEVACLNQVIEMGSLRVRYGCQTLRLEKLQTVAEKFDLDAYNMTNLVGCDQLVSVGGSMIVDIAMSNLPDFPKLERIGGMLAIGSRDQLQVLDGFDKLETIGVGQLGWGFDLAYHNQLSEISGFNQLEQVEGDFVITSCSLLESITGFQNLFHVQGSFSISYNSMLNDCSAFCTFLLNRDEALSTLIWNNGTDMGSPCWREPTLLDYCAYRPVTVQDVDLNYQFGKQKSPLQGALIELSEEGALVQSATTDIEGVAEFRYDELEEGIIYQLDVTHPEHDELLVRYRYSKADLLNGLELDFPLSVRKKIDTTTTALDSLNIQLNFLSANSDMEQISGYDIGPFLDFLNDWAVISEDHDEVIESMLRVALGVHQIQQYYLSSKPFSTKILKVAYDAYVNMKALASICKQTDGLENKITSFIESEEAKGNITFKGLYARASKDLILSILNQGFLITKNTLLTPYLQSFGNTPEEQEFVATMQRLIFFMENHLLKSDSELFKAGFVELFSQWLTVELIQHYYIDFATQQYVGEVVTESLERQGSFDEVFQYAQSTYMESQETNSEALFAADLLEPNAVQIASVGEILENLSLAITIASVGSLTPVAGPMMKVASGFKGLAGIMSGANFLNYGERIVFIPIELGDIVSHLSNRNLSLVETYPEGYLESFLLALGASLDSLQSYQAQLEIALEGAPLSSVSETYLDLNQYYQQDFSPMYTTMKDIAAHVTHTRDSLQRQFLFDYTSRIHQFEMQYLVLQMQLAAIHMDSASVNYRDSAVTTILEWSAMSDSLIDGFRTIYAGGTDLPFGPYVSVRSVTIPDSLTDNHFEMQVVIENAGPAMTPFFEVSLLPNENTEVYRLVNGEELSGPYDSLELVLGEQDELDFSVYVLDADSTITLTVDIKGVDGHDLSFPMNFISFEKLVNAIDLSGLRTEELVTLFPNPTRDAFTIQSQTNAKIEYVRIYQMTGQFVAITSDHIVHTHEWEPGLYLVEVVLDRVTVIKKLVVE